MITNEPEVQGQPATLTASAAAKVRELIEAEGEPDMALRLAVRPGGCSGFSYEMYFDNEFDESDIVAAVTPAPCWSRHSAAVSFTKG